MIQQRLPLRGSSSNGRLKASSPYTTEPKDLFTPIAPTSPNYNSQPIVEDGLKRIISPYVTKDISLSFSPSLKMRKMQYLGTPKKLRPQRPSTSASTSKMNQVSDRLNPTPVAIFDREEINRMSVENRMSVHGGVSTLQQLMREVEEKQREKRALQMLIDSLRSHTSNLGARKFRFAKRAESYHKETLRISDSTINKGNARIGIERSMIQLREAIGQYEYEIQHYINANIETSGYIYREQQQIKQLKENMAQTKRALIGAMKEKEAIRADLQVSSKIVKKIEEKYDTLMDKQDVMLNQISETKSIKS